MPHPCINLTEAFERYYPAIFKYYRYRGADSDTANDLASTVFERALVKLASFNPEKAAFPTWLFAIAHHLAINHWKAQARSRPVSLDVAALPASEPSPDEALLRQERLEILLAALQALEEREREIVALKFAGALTNRQISGLVGLSAGNVGVILYRALQKLKTRLSAVEGQVSHA
ncbi:MAG: sigma-70 family RNA polymerase sigma factor [Anaerolineaceae bacterium]|nr:sigma-70 family RNA polymerase sigma factor [Anaerolineaceae bacterium]